MLLDVCYTDNHLLAANKPAGLLTQPDDTGRDNLETQAKAWVKDVGSKPGAVFLHAVHRLDRPVSGLVLFARTSKALSRLNESQRRQQWRKIYHAVLTRPPPDAAGRLEHHLIHDDHRARLAQPGEEGAQLCRLQYRLLKMAGGLYLLEVELETGRYHQIRAQLAAAGCPVWGDERYGGASGGDDPGIGLHHVRLELPHPVKPETLRLEAAYPVGWPMASNGPSKLSKQPIDE